LDTSFPSNLAATFDARKPQQDAIAVSAGVTFVAVRRVFRLRDELVDDSHRERHEGTIQNFSHPTGRTLRPGVREAARRPHLGHILIAQRGDAFALPRLFRHLY